MPVLSVFSWICMINRKNYLLAQLTAVRGVALGGGGLTLDWSKVTMYLGSPLIIPSWALINITFGFVLIIWFIVPIVYGANVRNVKAHPIGGIMFPGLTSMNLVTMFTSVFTDVDGFFSGANAANRELLWAFLVGALLPIPGWVLSRWTRFTWLRHLHWPLILITISWMPALLSAGALFTWLLIGLTVYFSVGKYSWCGRYIYLASGALDLGVNLTQIIVNTAFINRRHPFPAWRGAKHNNGWDSCTLALSSKN
ncbi:unnamed protein product [Rotaria sp. Silwood1]|nr:unnamed protein product [Rotaria sp. Silwood1]